MRDFITIKSALQEMFKKVIQTEEKYQQYRLETWIYVRERKDIRARINEGKINIFTYS